jgi:hypothetical protein
MPTGVRLLVLTHRLFSPTLTTPPTLAAMAAPAGFGAWTWHSGPGRWDFHSDPSASEEVIHMGAVPGLGRTCPGGGTVRREEGRSQKGEGARSGLRCGPEQGAQAGPAFGAVPPDEVRLARQWAGLAEAHPALDLGPRLNPRAPVLRRQLRALAPRLGGGGQSRPTAQLLGCARVPGHDISPPTLLIAAQVIDPFSASSTHRDASHLHALIIAHLERSKYGYGLFRQILGLDLSATLGHSARPCSAQ